VIEEDTPDMSSVHAIYDDLRHANRAGERVATRLGPEAEVSVFVNADSYETALPAEDRCAGLGAALGALWCGVLGMVLFGVLNALFLWLPIAGGVAVGGLAGVLYGAIVGGIAGARAIDPRLEHIGLEVRHGRPVVMAKTDRGASAKTARRIFATSEGALAVG
jgi:hypothetical protein